MVVSINRLTNIITIDGSRIRIRFLNMLRNKYTGFSVRYGKVYTNSSLYGYCKEIYIL